MNPRCASARCAALLAALFVAPAFAANQPPAITLVVPDPQAVRSAPATLVLQATASDPDGTVAKVEFYRGQTRLGQVTTAPHQFNWNNIAAGTYTLTARATDHAGATATSAPITVSINAPPKVSLTAPKNAAVVAAPATVVLRATAADTDGTVAKVEFFNGATKLGESAIAPYQFHWLGVTAGSHALTAKATDNHGATTTSAPITLTAKTPPGVTLTAPANGTVALAPATVLLQATAAVERGSIAKVEFYRGSTKLGEATTPPFQLNWAGVPAGTYALTAKATDNTGIAATSPVVAFTVNHAPTITLAPPADGGVVHFPASITLKATASDPGGAVARVEFFAGATKLGEAVKAPFQFTWIGAAVGTHAVTARATDNLGATTTSPALSVIVNAPPQIALTAPATGSVVPAGNRVTLQATASDADGTIAKVEFFDGRTRLGETRAAPFQWVWADIRAGTHPLTAKATDNRGATTTSSAVTLIANAPPGVRITSPAADSIFTAPASLTIRATATDAGGSIAKVEFFHGSTKLGETTATPPQFTWSPVPAGAYSLTARATDNRGATTVSTAVNVRVNAPPTVALTAPATGAIVTSPATLTLQADAADTDGTIAKVEFYRGAAKLGEANTAPYRYTWSGAGTGTYSLTAKATDNLGASTTSAAVTVSVNALPAVKLIAPVAARKFVAPATILLRASASDAGGTVAKVEFFHGPTKLGESLTPPYQMSWPGVAAGTYSLTAVVTDHLGAKVTSSAVVVVVNAPPAVALTAPPAGTVVTAPGTVTLQATASDPDGTIAKVEFYRGQSRIGQDTDAPYQLSWSPPAGTYALTARATDNFGTVTPSTPVTLIVNAPPTVRLTSPANNAKFTAPATVALVANASDSDGTIAKVEFFSGSARLGETATPPYQFTWSGLAAGSYSLTARATDNHGATATSAAIAIKVAAPTSAPTITITTPPDGAIVAAAAPLTLTAKAGSFTKAITLVEFFNGAAKLGDAGVVSGSTDTYSLVLAAGLTAGTYTLTARATDISGALTHSAPSSLIVNALPVVALTAPASGAVLAAPAAITLAATASDADGSIAKVEFFHGTTKLGESATAPYQLTVTDLPADSYRFTARATDNRGATATSGTVPAIVGVAPAIALTTPADGTVFAAPADIPLAAAASDSDGPIAKVEFYHGTAKLGQATAAPYQFSWAAVPAGDYTLTAVATDHLGLTTASAPVAVSVDAPPAVALTSPPDNTVLAAPASVTLAATASDSDGSVAKVGFFSGTTKLGEATAAPYQFSWSAIGAGTYSLTAVAIDDQGIARTSSPVTLVVGQPPANLLAIDGGETTLTAPAAVALQVSTAGSANPITRVEFFRDGALVGTLTTPTGPATYSFSEPAPLAPGIYVYRTRVYDSLGIFTDSAPIAVTVLAGLPYLADFENTSGYNLGSLDRQLGWSVGQGSAIVTAQHYHTGARAVSLQPGTVAQIDQAFGPLANQPVVFADFFAKPQADTLIARATTFDVGSARFAFSINAAGQGALQAFDGDGGGVWMPLACTIPLGPGQQAQNWVRLTVRLDFANRTWDLYADGIMVAFDLGFRDNANSFLELFAIQGHAVGETLFDDLVAGPANPVFADLNANGIDDAWETARGLSLSTNNRALSPAGNGVTVIEAYVRGIDPNDFFAGLTPTLAIVSGDDQSASPGQFNGLPFVVAVLDRDGAPLGNAPVTFAVTQGGGLLGATSGSNTLAASLALRTGSDGLARGYYRQPAGVDVISRISATAGSAQAVFTTRTFPPGTKTIAAGASHSLALKFDGTVWSWGHNADGQLGDGTLAGGATPVPVSGLPAVSSLAGGDRHSLALLSDGTVSSWGANGEGQLGTGHTTGSTTPVAVTGLANVTAIASGARHNLALRSDGTVLAWGYNADGQLGNLTTTTALAPTPVATLTGITAIAAGTLHSIALKGDGSVWIWGGNTDGQLGTGTNTASSAPVAVNGLVGIAAIAAGESHTLAVKSDGTVWAWGFNGSGQLGDATTESRTAPVRVGTLTGIVAVAAGRAHSLALTTTGVVLAWGSDSRGQLGVGDLRDHPAPLPIPGAAGIVALAAGAHHTLLLKNDGSIVTLGDNTSGQLGGGTSGSGQPDAPAVTATTTNRPPAAALTSPLPDAIFPAPATIELTATASDADGAVARVEFHQGTTKLGEATQPPYTYSWVGAAPGNYLLFARAYDNRDASVDSIAIPISVRPAAAGPDDSDGNGLSDTWEIQYFGQIGVDPAADPDGDGVTNLEEFRLGRNPLKAAQSDTTGAVNLRLYLPHR